MNRQELTNLNSEVLLIYGELLKIISARNTNSTYDSGVSKYTYFKITEISKIWETEEKPLWDILSSLFIGLYSLDAEVSLVFSGDGKKLGVFLGSTPEYVDAVRRLLFGILPQTQLSENEDGDINLYSYNECSNNLKYGGILKGNPTGIENINTPIQIDSVIKGMRGKKWNISIFAKPISKKDTISRQQLYLTEATKYSILTDVSYTDDNNREAVSYNHVYHHSRQYCDKMDAFIQKTLESISVGEWLTTINFFAENANDSKLLGGLLSSTFFGDTSEPEPVHAL